MKILFFGISATDPVMFVGIGVIDRSRVVGLLDSGATRGEGRSDDCMRYE
ncbi:MAG: hypothetical protein ABI977_03690 [Acidobacteriota bacterium]